MMYYFRVF